MGAGELAGVVFGAGAAAGEGAGAVSAAVAGAAVAVGFMFYKKPKGLLRESWLRIRRVVVAAMPTTPLPATC